MTRDTASRHVITLLNSFREACRANYGRTLGARRASVMRHVGGASGARCGLCLILALLDLPSGLAFAAGPDDGVAFFESKIRPVLIEKCYSCHSDRAEKLKGGLKLDSRAGIRQGGDSGPAIVPGKPEESTLLQAIAHTDDFAKMPPKEKLPDPVIDD